ncbi:MAG: hypothetical protein V4681_03360 [Patescibacteria group bacterium]
MKLFATLATCLSLAASPAFAQSTSPGAFPPMTPSAAVMASPCDKLLTWRLQLYSDELVIRDLESRMKQTPNVSQSMWDSLTEIKKNIMASKANQTQLEKYCAIAARLPR